MAAGWGVDPTKDAGGIITSGTSSTDVRKVWSALYNPGLITGGVITRSSSQLTYTVSAGVGVIPISTTESIIAPIPAQTVSTTAPASGTRTDIIWARQNTPALNSNSDVVIGVSTSKPANAIELRRFIVSAGTTNTNAAVATGGVDYSVPYGSTGKILHQYRDTSNNTFTTSQTLGNGTFYLPTDRKVQISISATLSSQGAIRFDDSKYCEVFYQPFIDNIRQYTWSTGGLHQAWQVFQFEAFANLSAGVHTTHYAFRRDVGPGTPVRHHSGGDAWPGTYFVIRDAGVID